MNNPACAARLPAEVIAAYGDFLSSSAVITELYNFGGMSGASLYRVQTNGLDLCLRQWPAEHPTPERLRAIHQALRAAQEKGIEFLSVPMLNRFGGTALWVDHHGWELAPWLAGKADFHQQPTPARLHAAMAAIAGLHGAWQDHPWDGFEMPPRPIAHSPSYARRIDWLRQLLAGEAETLMSLVNRGPTSPLKDWSLAILMNFRPLAQKWLGELSAAAEVKVPLQVCLRDIWHDHVLFTGNEVTGVIDYGAMNVDSIAVDVARLGDSLVDDNEEAWEIALAAYHAQLPLSAEERLLAKALRRSSILLTGMQWISWLFAEERQFQRETIEQRLKKSLLRMQAHLDRW